MTILKNKEKEKLERSIDSLNNTIGKLNYYTEKSRIYDLLEVSGNSKKLLIRNFFSGILKGVGTGVRILCNYCSCNIVFKLYCKA